METKKNILFAYHRLDVIGGIETRFIDEFIFLKKNNYHVTLLAPTRKIDPNISKLLAIDELIPVDIKDLNSAKNFIDLVNSIIYSIRSREIDIISVHMFNKFVFASIIAAQICKIPVIFTLHGTPDIYKRPIDRVIYQGLADKSISLSVSVSKHLNAILNTHAPDICVIPNMINLEKYKSQTVNNNSTWLMVSRLSAEKLPSILKFLKTADSCRIQAVHLAGGGDKKVVKKIKTQIDSLQLKLNLKYLGQVSDIASLIPKYYGVAGLGRVALEGLACKKPVCILTPDGKLIGLVTANNFTYLKDYNFRGDTLNSIKISDFKKQIQRHTNSDSEEIYQMLCSSLSTLNWNRYIQHYNQVKFMPNDALEALYHKLDYFSNAIKAPFFEDTLFIHLLQETLLEYNLEDISEKLYFYQSSHGLNKKYPNPIKMNSRMSIKQRVLNLF